MTTENKYDIPNISIDVVPLYLDKTTSELNVVLGRRQYAPFVHEFALPGVLLTANERLNEAAVRALRTKTFLQNKDISTIFDLGTFDNPDRDPRGATVSIAKVAVVGKMFRPNNSNSVRVRPLHELVDVAKDKALLPFDHNNIIRSAGALVSEKLLHNKEFTQAILGDTFTTTNIKGILAQLSSFLGEDEAQFDFSNLGRTLKSSGWLSPVETPSAIAATVTAAAPAGMSARSGVVTNSSAVSGVRGRPSVTWKWSAGS